MKKSLGMTALVLAVAGGLLWQQSSVSAQKTKGKTRLAETKSLMKGIVSPSCGAVAKALKEKTLEEKDWATVALHATLLNELGYVLMDDGRCPDKDWAGAAKTLRECSAVVLEAAKAKQQEQAQAAFKKLTGACAGCHKAHKGK